MNPDPSSEEIITRIRHMIIERIETHEYIPGEAIPAERELARQFGISRAAARTAIDDLVNRHYLERIPGRGTFVRRQPLTKIALGVLGENDNASFSVLTRKFGIVHTNKLISAGIIADSRYFSWRMHLPPGEKIYCIHRIRLGNREPMVIEYTYVPLKLFPDIADYNFEQLSLYDYMASHHHLLVNFKEVMRMQRACARVRKALNISTEDDIVNYMEVTGYDSFGTLVEYTESYSKPDALEVRFVTNHCL